MLVANEMENLEAIDPNEYVRQHELFEEKRDEFMRKYLRRAWPIRVVRILGVFQLLISLGILGIDLPVILMFAPRWQVFAGIWTFVLGFIACVSTLHSSRRMTYEKLKWAAALNILAGIAVAVMIAFNVLYAVNPYVCVVSGGCNYLWYTYSAANSFYIGEIILGIALFSSVFLFLIIFAKYAIGGTALFENIQNGRAPADYKSIVPPPGAIPVPMNPTTGEGVYVAKRGLPPGYLQQRPPVPMMIRHPNGMMMRPPSAMMMQGPRGPGMMPPPPQPGAQMVGYYRQPIPQQAAALRYQN